MKTHIYAYHEMHGNIVDFGGWAMPVWYKGIIAEHNAVRNSVGMFDTSHMGRSMARGPDVERFVNRVVTNDVSKLKPSQGLYALMLRPNAGIVDDLITYKREGNAFFIVYNAANREKDFTWLKQNTSGLDVKLTDVSDEIAMIALQGPKAVETLQKVTEEDVSQVARFSIAKLTISGLECMAARTGYTGEDGFEIFILDCPVSSPDKALKVWNDLVEAGAVPCGLGARDSLRMEAGLNLYGNDIGETTNPLEARLRWAVKFKKKGGFIGIEALQAARADGIKQIQVGIQMVGRGLPRQHYDILESDGERVIGRVTSGGFAPTLGYGIAIGYVPVEYRKVGTPVMIRVRKKLVEGKIVKSHPFYDDSIYGWKRDKQ
ncbi:MAG: glycine cleavage system aminomethyltransferase GcvT [Candidatus Bathyarchaeota archaeon]|jgi:aminomethyltransferase|nr:glycine cleavage system aminomethyltransferase GcvT [Candidatus Bathyarchaeota archaeon]